ncbi:MAG TPA: 16S rRNA (cytosine(1402)-N(4))-methyltransferase RsmH [Candidatus Binatia bacterium]|nr:16S rRNA (cytosine(1402)-N(4))-methyltransferase RsmH [Candidatus Binatia bacterium]
MSKEVLEIFQGSAKKLFVDCTVGAGGHSHLILSTFPAARVIAFDQDPESIALARENLKDFGDRVRFKLGTFIGLFDHLNCLRPAVSGILVDPGISTVQLKDGPRGFSHSLDGPLDMRKDPLAPLTAADVLNSFPEVQLAEIFKKYGEVAEAGRLAKKIIEKRLFAPWRSTVQLRLQIEELTRWRPRPGSVHPAAKVFQALRIFINRELEGIDAWLEKIPDHLRAGARVVFITYHSLEDRLVKKGFQRLQQAEKARLLRPFPCFPSDAEIARNLASRSAKLRALEVA